MTPTSAVAGSPVLADRAQQAPGPSPTLLRACPPSPNAPPDGTTAGRHPLVVDLFSGPGGWAEGARMLGLPTVGIELDKSACATHAAAGHSTVRADVAQFDASRLAGKVTGLIASAPCTTFSAAGKRAGVAVTEILEDAIGDALAGHKTRAAHRRDMARVLRMAWWPDPKLTRAERSRRIRVAVLSASLVIEPARYIHAARPEWVALEQVPAVLPLWKAYARELRAARYSVWCGLLNSADFGVPQTRVRAILIASRVRRVSRPMPTHYDPRKGDQLFGEPWISMAAALGWGATGRSAPTVTAGGTSTGGAEPFGHRDREALAAEQAEGRWALRSDAREHAAVRAVTAPALALKFGHAAADMQWVVKRDRGRGRSQRYGDRADRPLDQPSPTISAGHHGSGPRMAWALQMDTQAKATLPRSVEEPAPTIQFAHRSNLAQWQTETESVRITVQEAAILQSFRGDYPWQGTKTKQFEAVGNAVPPLLAAHVLAEATGLAIPSLQQEAS